AAGPGRTAPGLPARRPPRRLRVQPPAEPPAAPALAGLPAPRHAADRPVRQHQPAGVRLPLGVHQCLAPTGRPRRAGPCGRLDRADRWRRRAAPRRESHGGEAMTAIDVHHHVVPDFYRARLEAAGLLRPIPGVAYPDWSPAASLAAMDRLGIDAAVVSITEPG